MIEIQLGQRPDGADTASCAGHEVATRHGASMALARRLKGAGMPDAPYRVIAPNGTPSHQGASFYALSEITVTETDRVRKFTRWAPMPEAVIPRDGEVLDAGARVGRVIGAAENDRPVAQHRDAA